MLYSVLFSLIGLREATDARAEATEVLRSPFLPHEGKMMLDR